jgi:ASC-1-like (ASCH) protein
MRLDNGDIPFLSSIKINDTISFTNTENSERIQTKVIGLCRFKSFNALVEFLGVQRCLTNSDNPPKDIDAYMELYYPREQIERCEKLGIVIDVKMRGM